MGTRTSPLDAEPFNESNNSGLKFTNTVTEGRRRCVHVEISNVCCRGWLIRQLETWSQNLEKCTLQRPLTDGDVPIVVEKLS